MTCRRAARMAAGWTCEKSKLRHKCRAFCSSAPLKRRHYREKSARSTSVTSAAGVLMRLTRPPGIESIEIIVSTGERGGRAGKRQEMRGRWRAPLLSQHPRGKSRRGEAPHRPVCKSTDSGGMQLSRSGQFACINAQASISLAEEI